MSRAEEFFRYFYHIKPNNSKLFFAKGEKPFSPMHKYCFMKARALGHPELANKIWDAENHTEVLYLDSVLIKDCDWSDSLHYMTRACTSFVCNSKKRSKHLICTGERSLLYYDKDTVDEFWGASPRHNKDRYLCKYSNWPGALIIHTSTKHSAPHKHC